MGCIILPVPITFVQRGRRDHSSLNPCRQAGHVLPKYSVIATIQEQEEHELAAAYEEHQKYK